MCGSVLCCPLLQVLEDAPIAEIIDVTAEVHQLRVDVSGHTAVGRGGTVQLAGHHTGTARREALSPPFHQGTKSANTAEEITQSSAIRVDRCSFPRHFIPLSPVLALKRIRPVN